MAVRDAPGGAAPGRRARRSAAAALPWQATSSRTLASAQWAFHSHVRGSANTGQSIPGNAINYQLQIVHGGNAAGRQRAAAFGHGRRYRWPRVCDRQRLVLASLHKPTKLSFVPASAGA